MPLHESLLSSLGRQIPEEQQFSPHCWQVCRVIETVLRDSLPGEKGQTVFP